ncbi:50S ribosomal protein L22 [Candidatus Campbellbacteria bacterium RIFOXYC2_FULL_35_25]|uniref:Large ribosomal subunit protein uL22 n=1 Tax=Candidatus Campbellbacteria bacterium RIFOXYC2_FULL_35_25 TaxID=1797582 RepID=A0A1F5EIG0_9BACT|nr:MAG: 50S ribosomal protein L22 [Candidatus Campbellbacteria bacterium RIFOXYC2_FULL_35_25]
MIKAELKNYRQSPRKVRLIADLVRGKDVSRALIELNFLNKKASLVIKKLLESAVANAKHNFNIEKANLFVKEIMVDEGATLKRRLAGSKGRAFPIKKRTSHIFVNLETKGEKELKKSKKTTKKEVVKNKETKEQKNTETKIKK